MADLIAQGMAWLGGQFKEHASRPVTYSRGAKRIAIERATRGRSQVEAETASDFGAVQRLESVDWLIDAADLDFGTGPFLPAVGDRVTETEGSRLLVYEVQPFGVLGDSHWRYADEPARLKLRVHTKLIDTMDAP